MKRPKQRPGGDRTPFERDELHIWFEGHRMKELRSSGDFLNAMANLTWAVRQLYLASCRVDADMGKMFRTIVSSALGPNGIAWEPERVYDAPTGVFMAWPKS